MKVLTNYGLYEVSSVEIDKYDEGPKRYYVKFYSYNHRVPIYYIYDLEYNDAFDIINEIAHIDDRVYVPEEYRHEVDKSEKRLYDL